MRNAPNKALNVNVSENLIFINLKESFKEDCIISCSDTVVINILTVFIYKNHQTNKVLMPNRDITVFITLLFQTQCNSEVGVHFGGSPHVYILNPKPSACNELTLRSGQLVTYTFKNLII